MSYRKKRTIYLSDSSGLADVICFFCSAVDGVITIIVSIISVIVGLLFVLNAFPSPGYIAPERFFFIPAFLVLSFLHIRLNTLLFSRNACFFDNTFGRKHRRNFILYSGLHKPADSLK